MRKILVSILLFLSMLSVTTLSIADPYEYARQIVAENPDKLDLWIKNGGTQQSLIETVKYNFNNIDAIDWDAIYRNVYGHNPNDPPKLGDPNNGGNGGDGSTFWFLDVTYILDNLQKQIPALVRLVVAIGYVVGLVFFVMAIMRLKAYGHQTVASAYHASIGPSLAYLGAGTALMYFPSMLSSGTATFFAGGGDSILGYAEFNNLPYAQLFVTVIMIVRLVGYIAFLRGWLMLSKVGSHSGQQGMMTKGIVHIIGGILAVNIVTTWEVLRATLGYVW
jgi:intracellular multiplication protein IcmC